MNPPGTQPTANLTNSQLRVLRSHAARLAAISADHWADALAVENYVSAGYWSVRYKRAAARCVALGELLRRADRGGPRAGRHVLGSRG
jgi:hypothetical protein